MKYTLPAGYTVRAAASADIPPLTEMLIAVDVHDFGKPDTEPEMITDDWSRSSFDVIRDTWLILTDAGQIAAYANTHKGGADLQVHPEHRDQGLEPYLIEAAEIRTLEQAAERGETSEPVIRFWANLQNPELRRQFADGGYREIRQIHRMQIDMEQAPPEPQWPAGVTVRPFRVGEDEARFCEAINVSFAHNWNFTPRTVEDFVTRTQQESFDPRLWLLAFEGEALIGVINGQVFLDFGWIPQLAVLPRARKRGIGASLLLASFGECWRQGLRTVSLAVDSENESGAHRLYEKVGMRTVRSHVRVEKQL